MTRMRTRTLLGCLLLILPALTLADPDPASAEPAGSAPKAAAEDKVVCKRVKTTGSHFKRRVCQKQSAWRAQREASQEEHRQMMSRPSTSAPG